MKIPGPNNVIIPPPIPSRIRLGTHAKQQQREDDFHMRAHISTAMKATTIMYAEEKEKANELLLRKVTDFINKKYQTTLILITLTVNI